jgi:glycosyltransferase involved in cell wall biosynthesis
MRIALCHYPPPGGAGRALDQLARHLASRHTVVVYRLHESAARGDGATMLAASALDEVVAYRAFRRRRFALYLNDWGEYRALTRVEAAWQTVAQRVDEGGYDVGLVSICRHSHAPAVLRHLQTPAAYFCHEPPRRLYEPWCRPDAAPQSPYVRLRQAWQQPARALLDEAVRRSDARNVRAVAAVLTNSCYTARRVRAVYHREAAVSYLGVDPETFHPDPGASPGGRVISVGSLEAHKGFDFVIRSLGRIPYQRRPLLTIVGATGHPRMPAYLSQLAAGLEVRLELCRGCTDAELAARYRASALFLFGARYEPFGLVALEAQASGLPVVAVAEGGVPEAIQDGHSGVLVPRDEAKFADAVDALMQDGARRRRWGQAARAAVLGRWSWDQAADRMEAHLARLGGQPGAAVGAS